MPSRMRVPLSATPFLWQGPREVLKLFQAWSFLSCVILGMLPNISEPLFPLWKWLVNTYKI